MISASNGNITLPAEFSNHGDSHLLCSPTKWSDIVVFFLGNYLAHAATIRSNPGDSFYVSTIFAITALLFPASGARQGLMGILSFAKFGRTDLQIAARAGALCRVVRMNEMEKIKAGYFRLTDSWNSKKVHGRVCLPEGYALAIVHKKAQFMRDDDPTPHLVLSSNFNTVSVLIAIGQLAVAITTLYRSRGDQIARYGYAAFGLTVLPYAFMSFINLLGNLICPQYPTLYLVESEEMREARALDGALFEGCVGELMEPRDEQSAPLRTDRDVLERDMWRWFLIGELTIIPIALSIVVIAAMSGFKKRSSTLVQRAGTMSWLASGSCWINLLEGRLIMAPVARFLKNLDGRYNPRLPEHSRERDEEFLLTYSKFFSWLYEIVYIGPAVFGFVVVGQMLSEYGSCTRID